MANPERRESILTSARTVFANQGFHKASVSDIIQEAGIARGTFYLYFESKRAVFDHILDDIFSRILWQLLPIEVPDPWDGEAILKQAYKNAERLAQLLLRDSDTVKVLVSEAMGMDAGANTQLTQFYGQLASWVAQSFEQGIELGIVRPCNALIAAHGIIGCVRGILWGWVVGLLPMDEDTFVKETMQFCLGGILKVDNQIK